MGRAASHPARQRPLIGASSVLLALAVAVLGGPQPVGASPGDVCSPDPPEYYRIDLISTKRVPGSGYASGTAEMLFSDSPFGVSLGADGSYRHLLDIRVARLAPAREGRYVAWVTTPSLDRAERLGVLDEDHRIQGPVKWNKFIAVISWEADEATDQDRWQGPIVMRGMSRSGKMHTMAGHGPFEQEKCATYGY